MTRIPRSFPEMRRRRSPQGFSKPLVVFLSPFSPCFATADTRGGEALYTRRGQCVLIRAVRASDEDACRRKRQRHGTREGCAERPGNTGRVFRPRRYGHVPSLESKQKARRKLAKLFPCFQGYSYAVNSRDKHKVIYCTR